MLGMYVEDAYEIWLFCISFFYVILVSIEPFIASLKQIFTLHLFGRSVAHGVCPCECFRFSFRQIFCLSLLILPMLTSYVGICIQGHSGGVTWFPRGVVSSSYFGHLGIV